MSSLEFPYSKLLVPIDKQVPITVRPDMTQLGRARNMFPAEQQFPIVNDMKIVGKGLARNPLFRNLFPKETPWALNEDVVFIINNTALGRYSESVENINELRESLKPTNLATNKEIWAHQSVRDAVRIIGEQRPIDVARFAAALTREISSNPELYEYMAGNDIIESDQATSVRATSVDPSSVDKMDFATLTNVASKMSSVPADIKPSLTNLEFESLRRLIKESEGLSTHDAIRAHYEAAKVDLMSRSTSLPVYWRNYFAVENRSSSDPVIVLLGEKEIEPLVSGVDPLNEFAYFSLFLLQAAHPTMERNFEFAFTRLLSLRMGLMGDTKEKCEMEWTGEHDAETNVSNFSWFVKTSRRPELLLACVWTSVISFLKSGHHATAANIDNTLQKVINSLNFSVTLERARELVAPAVYHGPHCGSVRVLYAMLLWKNSKESLVSSVSMRLHPTPPTSMAFTNLELFVESLNGARYFEIMDRKHEYESFKLAMQEIRSVMWFTCPYSDYLYGETRAEPTKAKEIASRLAGYAAALDFVMPGSTLRLSPSLKKIALQVGSNQIASQLLVESYVAGFRRYHRYFTESKFRGTVLKAGAQQILME